MTKKHLIIIAGITGEIGTHFANYYDEKYEIIGIGRNNKLTPKKKNINLINLDLSNPNKSHQVLSEIDFKKFKAITVIHSIGIDKFEHTNFPKLDTIETIDPKVYSSNVNTFKNLVRPIVLKIIDLRAQGYKIKLKLSTIGSVADKHNFLMLTSFGESKNIVRTYIKNLTQDYKWISGFIINVSSTVTKSAIMIRPHSNTKYWLTAREVVQKSAKKLISSRKKYEEIDIIKKDPKFVKNYYRNDFLIHKRWMKFTYNKQ